LIRQCRDLRPTLGGAATQLSCIDIFRRFSLRFVSLSISNYLWCRLISFSETRSTSAPNCRDQPIHREFPPGDSCGVISLFPMHSVLSVDIWPNVLLYLSTQQLAKFVSKAISLPRCTGAPSFSSKFQHNFFDPFLLSQNVHAYTMPRSVFLVFQGDIMFRNPVLSSFCTHI
jgi:hypothetical protein